MKKRGLYPLRKLHTSRSHRIDSALIGIFEKSQTATVIITQNGRSILYVNPIFLRLLGYRLEEMIGHRINDFISLENNDSGWILSSLLKDKDYWYGKPIPVRFKSGEFKEIKVILDTLQFNHLPCVMVVLDPQEDYRKFNPTAPDNQPGVSNKQPALENKAFSEIQHQLKAILDNIPDLAWMKDREGRFIAVNPPFAAACGLSVEAVIGKTDFDVWPAELANQYRSDDIEVIDIGQSKRVEEPLKDSSGNNSWIETIKVPIFDDQNLVIGTTGISRDITLRKLAEDNRQRMKGELEQLVLERTRELGLSNQKLIAEIEKHLEMDKIQSAVYQIAQATNLSDNLQDLFHSIHQILGTLMPVENFFIALYDPDTDMISFPYFVDEQDPPPVPRKLDHGVTAYVLRTGTPLLASPEVFDALALQNQLDNVGTPSIDWLGVPLATKIGIIGVMAVQSYHAEIRFGEEAKDILVYVSNQIGMAIDRVRKEESLRESEGRYRAVIEDQTELICRYSADGTILFANQALANFYDQPREALVGMPYFPLLPPEEQERSKKRLVYLIQFRQQYTSEQLNISPDGESRWISWTDRPLYDQQGSFLEFQSVGHDITSQKMRQRELESIVTITTALRSAQNRVDMAPVILDQIMPMFGATAAALAVLDENQKSLVVELGRGIWSNTTGTPIVSNESMAGIVLNLGKAYAYPSEAGESILPTFELGAGQPSIACVPLSSQERPMGVIWVGRRLPFLANDLHLLTALSDIAANAFHRSELHEQTKNQLNRLTALRAIDMAISANLDIEVTLKILVEQIVNQLGLNAAIVFRFDPLTLTLKVAAGSGVPGKYLRPDKIDLGESCAGKIALLQEMEVITDLGAGDNQFPYTLKQSGLPFKSYIGLPLVAKGLVKGVLELYHLDQLKPDPEWLNYLQAIAAQAAIAIDNAELLEKLQKSNQDLRQAYDETIEGWARTLEIRDKETVGHSRRVVDLTLNLIAALGEDHLEKDQVRRGVLLHDIGKMAIPDSILLKPNRLDEDEWKIMHSHPEIAYKLLQPINYLNSALDIPYCHHEKWDGSGYPRGLEGEQIPMAARIFAIVDVWDALSHDRPYNAAWLRADILSYIKGQSGRQFDPRVVDAFMEYIENNDQDYAGDDLDPRN